MALSKSQRWAEMASRIDDETLDQWVVCATYDQLADQVLQRYSGLIDRIELSIPVTGPQEEQMLREIVAQIRSST